jgi:ferredoxin-thioredoxin reductase catalytic subunit/rubredoxin
LIALEKVQQRAEADAKFHGYHLNPDQDFLRNLLEGLKLNEERYGYPTCPCRLATGKLEFDRDIICPCDYRDPDVEEYGACYCALYVRNDLYEGKTPVQPIPERRPLTKQTRAYEIMASTTTLEKQAEPAVTISKGALEIKLKFWRCKQCGYVVFREDPPYICPICKAKKEMFSEINIRLDAQG